MKRWMTLILAASLITGCSQNEDAESTEEPVEETAEQAQTENAKEQDEQKNKEDESEETTEKKTSDSNQAEEQPKSEEDKGNEAAKEQQPQEEKPASTEDTDLTTQMKKEKGIADGKIYTKEGTAYGTIIFQEGVTDAQAKQIAEKYAQKLKEKYADKQVNVQGVRKSGNVVNITL